MLMDEKEASISNGEKSIVDSSVLCVNCVTPVQNHNTDNTNKGSDNTDNTDNTITQITQYKEKIYNKLNNKQKIILVVLDKWLNATHSRRIQNSKNQWIYTT